MTPEGIAAVIAEHARHFAGCLLYRINAPKGPCLTYRLAVHAQQQAEALAAERAKVARLRDYWLQPTEPNSFHINGFPTVIDQLADLFDEEAANTLRTALAAGSEQVTDRG